MADAKLSPEADKFIEAACQEYNKKMADLMNEWGFDDFEEWSIDQQTGIFLIKFDDQSKVVANGQVFGSYSKENGTWEWAWNNPFILDPLKKDSLSIQSYGENENISYLNEGIIPIANDTAAAYLSAIGMKVTASEGVFIGNSGEILVFIGLKNLKRSFSHEDSK